MNVMGYLYILLTICFTVYGQLILKWRINTLEVTLPAALTEKILFLFKLLLDPWIISGLFAAFIASIFWMAAMTKFDVSHAYPIIVGGLAVLTTVFAIILLKEPVSVYKILGLGSVIVGIYFLGKGA